MNYSQIAFLFMQGTLVALVILLLFHLRKQLGIGVMFACLGLFQFVQVFLYSTVYVSVTSDFNVSPGSAVFFTATLFVLLMVYIKEDASETKKIIYALFIVNIVMAVLSRTLNWHIGNSGIEGGLGLSKNLFNVGVWELFIGTITLFLDAFLIIILFEFISRKVRFLFLQICLTMLIVVSFDTLFFATLTFWGLESLKLIIISGLISKGVFTIFYSILLYSYLRFFDSTDPLRYIFNLKDVFKPLTYKQKFESAEKEIKETAEMHRILTEHSNDLICLQEPDSTFKYISPSIKRMLGYEQSEYLGKQVFNIVHKDDVLVLKEALSQKKFNDGGVIDAFPFRIRHKDGHFVWLEFLASPIYKDNEISYFVTTTRDITHRIIANQKIQTSLELLEKSENSLKEASKIAKIGYQEYDLATDTYNWSDYVYDIYGLDSRGKIPSMKEIVSIFDEESQEKIKEISKNLMIKGASCDVELRCINLKKEEVWVRYVAKAVYNQKNEVIGRSGVVHNITASKKAQIELELSKEKIQNSLQLLEKRKYSMNEASKIAKIGYWEHDFITGAVLWSEYVYQIFELNPIDGIPLQKEVYKNFSKESLDKLEQATLELTSKGISYDIELKWINQKEEEVWVRNVGQPVYNKEEEIIGKRGVLQNITASKKAQLELEFSRQKIQTTLNLLEESEYSKNEASKTAKIGFLEDDIATETYIWSDYLYHIFGFDPKQPVLSRKDIAVLFNEDSQKKMAEATLNLDTKGIPFDLQLKMINLRKEEVWIRIVVEPIYNDQNKIVKRRGVLQDITESKKAQHQLEVSTQKIQTSLELLERSEYSKNEMSKVAKIGYQDYDIDTDTYVWSDYMYQVLEFDKKDGVPTLDQILPIFDKESQEKIAKASLDIDLSGLASDLTVRYINSKKEEVWLRYLAHPVYNKENNIVGRKGVLHNITDYKKALLELEISKQKIKDSLDLLAIKENSMGEGSKMAKIGYWEYDIAADTYIWSDYLYHIYGIDQNKRIPFRNEILKCLDQESQVKMAEATNNLILTGNSYDIELRMINRRKEEVWVRNVVQPIYNQQNEIIGRRGVTQNITASKKAQFELELSKQKIQNSLDLLEKRKYSMDEASKIAKMGYHEYDIATDTFMWSEHLYHIFGLDIKDRVPARKEILSFFDEESQQKMAKATKELDTKGIPYDLELKILNKRKEEVWVRNVAQPVYNQQNEIIGRRGVTQNITEKKLIEEANLMITSRYRELFDSATVSIWNGDLSLVMQQLAELKKHDIPNIKTYFEEHPEVLFSILGKVKINKVNKATVKLFKAESAEDFLQGKIQDTFGKGAHKVFSDLIVSIWNNEKTFISEVNYKTLKGDEFAAIISIPIPQTEIEQKTVPVSIQSIQSIKDAESAKRESINKLKEAQKLAKVGSWIFNPFNDESEWSEETFRIWGVDPKLGSPKFDTILKQIHRDDLELHNSSVDKAIRLGISFDIEFRIFLPDGTQKTLRGLCQPVIGSTGEVINLKGTNQDITEQKRITSEIEKAEEMYRILTDNSNDLICLHEMDSTFKYISPSIKNILGYNQSELLGKKVFGVIHEEDIDSLKNVMSQRMFSSMVIDAFVCRVLHKEGHYVWLEFLSSPVYKNNKVSSFISTARDITQSILAKQEIEEYQVSLQKLTTEMTVIEEKQKKEIATNIHDHLSQSLVISKMKINELKKRSQLKMIDEDLKFIETHISEALENSRKITYELSPPVLYQLGIIEALNWLFDNVEVTHKIKCVINSNVDSINLDEIKSILLYRSIQEVLMNAIKYANATLITLGLDKNKLGLDIFITDNGVGFDTSVLNNNQNHTGSGFGLFTVQERIRNIQGKFTIKSKINEGTSIKIFIPLSK
ncbi:PAS domain-containing protein [Polaribacter sp. L3A8]|uniref:PAS domain-containing protein n=1 Tax=Polaribacter sp. L3A8 TaxID=2686361 RepID=UPI00131B0F75|nr:PAS domain-containing protein [Polaribacter sp. L3A8]